MTNENCSEVWGSASVRDNLSYLFRYLCFDGFSCSLSVYYLHILLILLLILYIFGIPGIPFILLIMPAMRAMFVPVTIFIILRVWSNCLMSRFTS